MDSVSYHAFARHFQISENLRGEPLLRKIAHSFQTIPYENLTKIVGNESGNGFETALHRPNDVLDQFLQHGAGGTCFSLTAAFLELVRSVGFVADPILADRRYGHDTHCAVRVLLSGVPHLLDPGYLLCDPIPLACATEQTFATAFNRIILRPQASTGKLDLLTVENGREKYRLTYKTEPVDEQTFHEAWRKSFDWDMMKYPLLTRVVDNRQLYLQGNKLQIRTHDGVERREIDPLHLSGVIESEFGIAARISQAAIAILNHKGEPIGSSRIS